MLTDKDLLDVYTHLSGSAGLGRQMLGKQRALHKGLFQ
jgi:hypothetical protein